MDQDISPREIARQQREEAMFREQQGEPMGDAELIRRMHGMHWRLRLRNPATPAEKAEWAALRAELYRRHPPTPVRN